MDIAYRTVVLLSIKPELADKIFTGEKKYEYRREMFGREMGKVIVYASAPVKKVIGEFNNGGIKFGRIDDIWRATKDESGISEESFYQYFSPLHWGHVLKIDNPVLYDKPLDLKSYGIIHPPQSFRYLSFCGGKPMLNKRGLNERIYM